MQIYAAGVDIGNATTETALGLIENGKLVRITEGIARTTGLKGTSGNMEGILRSIKDAARNMGIDVKRISFIRINEATPVIGDFAMETITETILTESTLIGHDPDTPGGIGTGTGMTIDIREMENAETGKPYIVIVPGSIDFREASEKINKAVEKGAQINGAVLQNDDGVLVSNRLVKKIPVVDEVAAIDKVPIGMPAAVEVAAQGCSIEKLSDPYGIASVFSLSPEETEKVVYIAKALIGNRSAVVIRTPSGDIRERRIPAGELIFFNEKTSRRVPVDKGAREIMQAAARCGKIKDVAGTRGSNVGGMLETVKSRMADMTGQAKDAIRIRDILAVDTIVPREVNGSLAREFSMEKAVGIAAMVKTEKLHMKALAEELSERIGIPVEIGGVEGQMALKGALTTPGAGKPLLIADIGAGSTDACVTEPNGDTRYVHLAGAGTMVTMLINAELGLNDIRVAEDIKKYPLAKAESLYHIRHEDGTAEFFLEPMDSSLFGRVVVLSPDGMKPLYTKRSMERIRQVRREAKEKVLISNILRALEKLSPSGNISEFSRLLLVGGSALDFELGNMVTDRLSYYGIVSGKANVRASQGPRNAVATGLLLSFLDDMAGTLRE